MAGILDTSLRNFPRPWWQPLVSLLITLYGILVLGWHLKPVVFLFWWEVVLMVGAALIRMLAAQNGRPFGELLTQKLVLLVVGGMLGFLMISLSVAFTFKGFDNSEGSEGLATVPTEIRLLNLAYLAGLALHFFANGRYKTAEPVTELVRTLVHLLVLLALLMAVTMHLLPRFPQLEQARWVAVAIVVLKFVVDGLFAWVNKGAPGLKQV